VLAGAASHAPTITAMRDLAGSDERERFSRGMEALAERVRAERADTFVVITSDHFTNFGPDAMPTFALGIAERYAGPVERWLRVEQRTFSGAPALAAHLARALVGDGFDLVLTRDVALEHGVMVPLSFLVDEEHADIVPIVVNCMVPPLPTLRRCYAFGRALGAALAGREERVVVLGTGGLSHAPGSPDNGRIDVDFDRWFLERLAARDIEALLELSNERIDAAGFGAWEVRTWIAALGAAAVLEPEVLTYEPLAAWETGVAAAVFTPATHRSDR
jgi:aromatic ring-opening dioxygenase catalytic subunit (LigB family)